MYDEDESTFDLFDLDELEAILTADYEETLKFLKNANQYEIMCASDVLVAIVETFPQYDWVKLFKEKADIITDLESPHIDKEEYFSNIREAEYVIKNPYRKLKPETLATIHKVLTTLPRLSKNQLDEISRFDNFDLLTQIIDDKIQEIQKRKDKNHGEAINQQWLEDLISANKDIRDETNPRIDVNHIIKNVDVSGLLSTRYKVSKKHKKHKQ